MFFGGGGDLGGHFGDVRNGFADAHQGLVGFQYPGHAFLGLALAVFHALHGIVGGRLQLGDQPMDLHGGLGGALGQLAHFIGHHRKAPAHIPGACGFNRGVERQQVGLIGDAFDHIDHAADLVAVPGQLRHGGAGLADHGGQAFDGLTGIARHLTATPGQHIGLLGGIGGALHVTGDFLGGRGHLVDCGGDLFGFRALTIQAFGAGVGQLIGLPGQGAELFGAVLQAREAGLQARGLAEERGFQTSLGAACVTVHLCDQGIRGRRLDPRQQA